MNVRMAITAARRMGGASLLFLAALLIFALPDSVIASLQYDRAQIGAGEMYRLLTCHWTHWNVDHLIWDAGALLFLAAACERRSRSRFLATLTLATLVVPIGVFILQPEMLRYRGLSALASALFAWLAIDIVRNRAHAGQWAWVFAIGTIGLGFAIKIAIEIHCGTAVFVETSSDFVPVPLAHLIGACCGLATACCTAPKVTTEAESSGESSPSPLVGAG